MQKHKEKNLEWLEDERILIEPKQQQH